MKKNEKGENMTWNSPQEFARLATDLIISEGKSRKRRFAALKARKTKIYNKIMKIARGGEGYLGGMYFKKFVPVDQNGNE